ncbi:MAG: hypothetical protein ACTIA6_10975 [Pseudoclavibacter sp.]
MARYGFKLLRIELREGQRQRALDFGNPGGGKSEVPYLDYVTSDIEAAIAKRERMLREAQGKPESATLSAGPVALENDDVMEESETPDQSLTNQQLVVVRLNRIERRQSAVLIEAFYGKVGDHSKAVHPDSRQEDLELKDRATTRNYRALLIAPEKGTRGFLAVERISRSHLGTQLSKRLFSGRQEHDFKLKEIGPVADEESVAKLMDSRVSQIKVKRSVLGGDSTSPDEYETELIFKLGKSSSDARTVFERVKTWIPTKKNLASNRKLSATEEANAVVSMLWPGLDESTFTDPVATLEGKYPKKLGPLDMREGFVYELGSVRPSDETFIDEIRDTVDRLQLVEKVNLSENWHSKIPPVPNVGGSS